MNNSAPWWHTLYDDFLALMLLEQGSDEEIDQTIQFLVEVLGIKPGASIFDQCCGTGRLSAPLGERGFDMYGVDLIPSYISKAREKNSAGKFVAADAFEFVCEKKCDAGINWWTSFGYAETDEENLRMLGRAFESLKAGGKFALDFMNTTGVVHHFKPEVISKCQHPEMGEILLIRESRIDPENGLLLKNWNYYPENGDRKSHASAVRLYDAPTLVGLFERSGFVDMEIFGDLQQGCLTIDSPRCIVVGKKPNR